MTPWALVAVLSVPAVARAQPAAAPPAAEPPPDGGWVCRRADCGPSEPRFAVGVAGGHIDLDEAGEGRQHAILGRVMLAHGFAVEVELARADLGDSGTARTGGVGLDKLFCAHRRLSPYLAAAAGGGRLERADGSESRLGYGELGGGLMLRGRHLALALDLRAGVRRSEAAADATVTAAMTAPSDDGDDWQRDRYHRARLMLLLQF